MSTSNYVEQSRNSCALHGALATFGAIENVAPVLHATGGCGIQYQQGVAGFGGCHTAASSLGAPLSSTNIIEKHVVFGGGSRLREQLKNTVKVVNADLYPVVTSCATEMVGDDIAAMAKEGLDQGFPVLYSNTPGFSGPFHRGYQLALRALIEQIPQIYKVENEKRARSVNILGIIPQQDIFWQGHLFQLVELFREFGIEANALFGIGQDVDSWRKAPGAALNISFSYWGRDAAAELSALYGSPWLDFSFAPIGAQAVTELIDAVSEHIDLDADRISETRNREELLLRSYLSRIAPFYYSKNFQREFAIVGELALVTGVTQFLTKTLGLIPAVAVVTDPLPPDESEQNASRLRKIVSEFDGQIVFEDDFENIASLLKQKSPQLVIGSSYEKFAAAELGIPFLPIAFPLSDRLVLSRGYIGYQGAIELVEDLGSAILGNQ